ncbi:choice-of-anchor D domain-containing protein [Actinacidiphila reveromycinica]|uniref:choice-of-anchor D domain-containing protein n=1 Tax=Actinacidiphila reveromycinica TaxID=659352 RepID=UPI001F2A3992|nr:choice-of-anchor D domain-containing protein [Streptomyces sp. SN-593]
MVAVGGTTAVLAAGGVLGLAFQPAVAATAAAATGGSGANLPYTEVQAENSATNGTVIGPSYAAGNLADEASQRKAVTLQGSGKYVTFTTPVATNSIDFRYSIPDTASGSVYTAPLSLYVNGTKQPDFTLTNAYSWYYGSYPFTNSPGTNQHHFYDEAHRLFGQTYPAGTTFKFQVDAGDTASSYTLDFADFEQVGAALPQPAGSVSVTSTGADSSGAADSTAAFNAAIAAAGSGGTVWIPSGTYKIPGHISVNNVTIAGAGMWYSTVTGAAPGFYGTYGTGGAPSTNVHLKDFAIFGDVQERDDNAQVNGIGGAMSNSSVADVWIDHMKVGAWMDGPMDKLTFSGMRIRDTTADGINFHGGVTNSTVTGSDIRNTGDDGIATWADSALGADANDTISNNTVQFQTLANGIAIYGGHDNTVTGNLVQDTGLAQGGGIHVGQRFTSTPVGTTTISNNTMIRDGSLDPNWQFGVGALWFDGSQGAITGPINVSNALIEQSPYEAVQWVEGTVSGVNLSNVTIAGTGTFALQEQTGGAAKFTNVTATGVGAPSPVYSCEGGNFAVTDGGGNSGIDGTPVCGPWPTPVFPPYPPSGVTASPSALSFGSVANGATSAAQSVTVSNPTGAAAAVSSIAASGDFAQTNTCGSSIAANGSCTVSVKFSPTATGARTGTLTVAAGGVTNTVTLTGTGTAPGPVLGATPGGLSFAGTVVGSTTAAQAVTVTNSGTTAATVSGVTATGDFAQTNNCATVAVGASCTVNVTFKPTTGGARTGTLSVASNANNSPTTVALTGTGIDSTTNIAAGRPATASSSNAPYVAGNVTDADASTYWESVADSFPQWAQVDLGANYGVNKVVLKLPPATAWAARSETLSVQGSTDGSTFSTLAASAAHTFDPATGNTVTITFNSATARYVRVNVTANTGWSAAQLSDLEVFPSGSGGTTPPASATLAASPVSLSFGSVAPGISSSPQTVTLTNGGSAAASVSSIAVSGDFAQTNTCGSSIAAGANCTVSVTFKPTTTGARTGTLTVTGSASNSPTTVPLSGTGTGTVSANLALHKTATESSHTDVYPASNVTDGSQDTYWESANNAFPQWVQVDLGSAQSASRVVLQLPASWAARSQTVSLTASTDGSTFTTLKASASYSFTPTSSNTVTLSFPATSQRYFRLNFTANTGWPAGQLSEFQVWNI